MKLIDRKPVTLTLTILLSLFFILSWGQQREYDVNYNKSLKNNQFERVYQSEKEIGDGRKHAYMIYYPEEYQYDSIKIFPLLVYLHGRSERGEFEYSKISRHGPHNYLNSGNKLPFIVASPQSYKYSGGWEPENVREFIDFIIKTNRVDTSRIYLTGISMGGAGVWRYAMEYPDKVTAIAPMSGWGNPNLACKLKEVPIWAFHGEKDNTVAVRSSKDMVNAVNRCNGNAKLTIVPDAGHACWSEAYNDPEFYQWLMHQK